VREDIDTSILKVPPLFIQTYTENAIWHGLTHKEEKGYLEIKLPGKNGLLCRKLPDNGVDHCRFATKQTG